MSITYTIQRETPDLEETVIEVTGTANNYSFEPVVTESGQAIILTEFEQSRIEEKLMDEAYYDYPDFWGE